MLEFILVGLVLLVPLVYLVITLGSIQGQSLGAEAGARHIARAIALSSDSDEARDRTDRILAAVVEEYGIDDSAVEIALHCRPASADCPSAGATVVVTVRTSVSLPLVPPVLGLDRIASVPVEASSAQKVSRFWGVGS
ncbi:TadE family protein [Microbacterium sp. C7(2022)]|uniref:TadE family protein n=1 Tax=Microbacterium sp. C7(2022) TaxID=2992759 RepID=UPI00237A1075|nr:TadE family protein [Microbacterium sp. C7(2022)]